MLIYICDQALFGCFLQGCKNSDFSFWESHKNYWSDVDCYQWTLFLSPEILWKLFIVEYLKTTNIWKHILKLYLLYNSKLSYMIAVRKLPAMWCFEKNYHTFVSIAGFNSFCFVYRSHKEIIIKTRQLSGILYLYLKVQWIFLWALKCIWSFKNMNI